MVKKIYFPREVLPLSFTISQFVNMLLSFIIVLLAVIFSGVTINLAAWLFLPLIMMIEFFWHWELRILFLHLMCTLEI